MSEISFETKQFSVQDRSQRRFPSNSFQQTVIKICKIQMVRQPLRFSMPLFWFRASSKSFYKITKNPNCSFETNKHSNNFLSGRCIADGEDLTGNYNDERYIDFFVAKFGVFHKSDKSVLHSHQQSKLYFQVKFNFLPPTVANIKSEQSGKLPG